MKVAKQNETLAKELTNISLYLIKAIKAYMEKNGFTQDYLAKCLSWKQGTISKKLNEKNIQNFSGTYWYLSLHDARLFCEAMDSTVGTVLHEYDV